MLLSPLYGQIVSFKVHMTGTFIVLRRLGMCNIKGIETWKIIC